MFLDGGGSADSKMEGNEGGAYKLVVSVLKMELWEWLCCLRGEIASAMVKR